MIKYRVQLLLISDVDGKESSFSLGVRYNCSFSKVRSDVFQQYNLSGSDSTNTWAISYLGDVETLVANTRGRNENENCKSSRSS